MRKILTFLFAALMSVGMWALDPIEWNDLPGDGDEFTNDGVTLTCDEFDNDEGTNIYGPGTFTTDLGNFTQIEVTAGYLSSSFGGDGWVEDGEDENKMIWTGHAANVSFGGNVFGLTKIVFTIEPGSAPAVAFTPLTGDTWDDASKTLTVNSNLPEDAYHGQTVIEHVIISSAVTSIGQMAFSGCSSLSSVTIPESVTSIEDFVFYECSGLMSITIPNSVTSIGESAFFGCSSLMSITIPNSVTSIGQSAFQECSNLASIEIPNSVTSIGYMTFDECTGLTSVTIPNSVTSIGGYAFYGCSGLTSITIPNSVESIGDLAFTGCSSLSSVTIPNSVTSIGKQAFQNCSGLTSIEISNSVTSIVYGAFASCSGLTSVTIPSSVTSIGQIAFQHCTGLTSIEIPNGVTSIGQSAFAGCDGLTSMTIDATTPPSLGTYAFRYINLSACKLYVPASSGSAYKAAAVWQDFDFYTNPTAHEEPLNEGTYYSTFYDSDDIYLLPTGVEAYVATLSGSNLLLTKIAEAGEYIPKNCAVILKSTVESYDLFISKETPVTFTATNNLEGTDVAKATPANCYVLSCENNQVGFYQYSGEQVAAHKAYVVFSGSNQAPRRMPFIFDQTTGVENVQGDKVQSTKVLRDGQLIIIRNGVEYNANGMMVK